MHFHDIFVVLHVLRPLDTGLNLLTVCTDNYCHVWGWLGSGWFIYQNKCTQTVKLHRFTSCHLDTSVQAFSVKWLMMKYGESHYSTDSPIDWNFISFQCVCSNFEGLFLIFMLLQFYCTAHLWISLKGTTACLRQASLFLAFARQFCQYQHAPAGFLLSDRHSDKLYILQ